MVGLFHVQNTDLVFLFVLYSGATVTKQNMLVFHKPVLAFTIKHKYLQMPCIIVYMKRSCFQFLVDGAFREKSGLVYIHVY